jgi:hypothetical protein
MLDHTCIQPSPPIHLSDSELQAVIDACKPLQPRDRDAFLKDVAQEIAALPMRGDGAIHRVIATVQRRHWDPPHLGTSGKYR